MFEKPLILHLVIAEQGASRQKKKRAKPLPPSRGFFGFSQKPERGFSPVGKEVAIATDERSETTAAPSATGRGDGADP